jgi:beta-N-acetylhexosaminidase
MSYAQRAGQLVMAGARASSPDDARALVAAQHLGSVFMNGRTSRSPAAIKADLRRLPGQKTTDATVGLLVSADVEGGKVQKLTNAAFGVIPAAAVQGTWSAAKLTARTKVWATAMHAAGVNMDLAPVADTVPPGTADRNPPIGALQRNYGTTSTTVSKAVTAVSGALAAARVVPTAKHFPGLGRVRANTDTSTRAVDSVTTATSAYLKPFRAGIDAGAGAVMVSSARYPKIDSANLAVFSSKVVTGLLRERMGYAGVVMSDDVGRAKAVASVSAGSRATRFIAAGGDVVLTVVPAQAPTMVTAIRAKANASPAFKAQVNAAALRVLELKQSYGLLRCS